MGKWITLLEASKRKKISKPGMMKQVTRFLETRDPSHIAPFTDASKKNQGRWMLLLPDSQPETLEAFSDDASLPAVPTPDTQEFARRLAQVTDLLLSQQRQIEHLTALVEAQGRQAAERDRAREQAEYRAAIERLDAMTLKQQVALAQLEDLASRIVSKETVDVQRYEDQIPRLQQQVNDLQPQIEKINNRMNRAGDSQREPSGDTLELPTRKHPPGYTGGCDREGREC